MRDGIEAFFDHALAGRRALEIAQPRLRLAHHPRVRLLRLGQAASRSRQARCGSSVKSVCRSTTVPRPAAETTCCALTVCGSQMISRGSVFATSAAVSGACVARANGWKSTRSSFERISPFRLSCTIDRRMRAHVFESIQTVPR